jgi:type IV secretory pathway VirB4 component
VKFSAENLRVPFEGIGEKEIFQNLIQTIFYFVFLCYNYPMAVSSKATQEFVPIKEVRDGIVILKDGSMRGIVLTSSLNFSLKSDDERNAITIQFQDFLNSLDFPVQIVIQSRRLDIRPYLALLEEQYKVQLNDLMKIQTREYIEFIKKFTESTNIMTKSFFVVVPYEPAIVDVKSGGALGIFQKKSSDEVASRKQATFEENRTQLEQRVSVVEQGLVRCGIRVIRLGTEEVIELFYKVFNPGDSEKPIKIT